MDSSDSSTHVRYGCTIGSTICLKVKLGIEGVTWTFNKERILCEGGSGLGFEKKNADATDSGIYQCKVGDQVKYTFDVIVCDNYNMYDVKVRKTINLKVNTEFICPTWTLNGKRVESQCHPQKGFRKEQVTFDDSGRYICKMNDTVIHAFDVLVYDEIMCCVGDEICFPIKTKDSFTSLTLQGEVICYAGGKICFPIKTNASVTSWTLNGETVKVGLYLERYIKLIESIHDLGRYVCKENLEVKYACDVIHYRNIDIKKGSTIRFEIVSNAYCPTWTFNGDDVSPECYLQNGFEKKDAVFGDVGRYECKVENQVKCVYEVLVTDCYEFDVGSDLYIKTDTGDKCPLWTFENDLSYGMEETIRSETDPRTGLLKKNVVESDAGRYRCKVNCRMIFTFDVSVHDYSKCNIGSTIHLLGNNTDLTYSTKWTLNGQPVITECDPRKGFKKSNAEISDAGRYECITLDRLKYSIDLKVYKSYECRFGSTIYLEMKTVHNCPIWCLNGKNVLSECDPQKGFQKKNATFNDSGIYKCKVDDEVIDEIEVIVFEFLFEDDFLGVRLTVPGDTSGQKPGTLKENWKSLRSHSEGLSIDEQHKIGRDDSKVTRKDETNRDDKKDKENLTKDAQLEVNKEDSENMKRDGRFNEDMTKCPEPRNFISNLTAIIVFICATITGVITKLCYDLRRRAVFVFAALTASHDEIEKYNMSERPRGPDASEEYSMTKRPKGLAVLVCIDTFHKEEMNVMGMRDENIKKCSNTFKEIDFDPYICDVSTADEIEAYLDKIASKGLTNYDCLVLYLSSHGGNGYMYCCDYRVEEKKPKGFLYFHSLIEKFLPEKCPDLKGKPKLFFFDCCRVQDDKANWIHASPVRSLTQEKAGMYQHILVGYAAITGTSCYATKEGSFYTKHLTKCIDESAAGTSLLEVLVKVNRRVQEDVASETKKYGKSIDQITEVGYTLDRKIILKNTFGNIDK